MANYLFMVQEKNRLAQRGLLKRFSLNCVGHQETIEEMRAEKSEKYMELKSKRNSPEFEEWFLRYRPQDVKALKEQEKDKKDKGTNKGTNKTKTQKNKNKSRKAKTKTKKGFGIFF
jgi:hypothetical protein